MAEIAEFDDFVVARSHALVRSAYLLVRDEGLAEDLVQTALAKAWFAWRRIDDPEAYVRASDGHDVDVVVAPPLGRGEPRPRSRCRGPRQAT